VFRQDRTNPSTAVSTWKGRRDLPKANPSTAVSAWMNGGLAGGSAAFTAFGGLITQYDDSGTTYRVHTFRSTSYFEVLAGSPDTDITYLVVGGGGGGGGPTSNAAGGGGGAGGLATGTFTASAGTYYSCTIGDGGNLIASSRQYGGTSGTNDGLGVVGGTSHITPDGSSALVTEVGGGGGGGSSSSGANRDGTAGASGGGGGMYSGQTAGSGGSATAGFAGGNAAAGSTNAMGGGGGGHSQVGFSASGPPNFGWKGGTGSQGLTNHSGTQPYYAAGGASSAYSASSGGGRTNSISGQSQLYSGSVVQTADAAIPNTGSGGGAAGLAVQSGAGSAGIIVLRYEVV